ncbi:MAG: MltA domain-containing protein, partial [Caldimonas sp.]
MSSAFRRAHAVVAAAILGTLAACSTTTLPLVDERPAVATAAARATGVPSAAVPPAATAANAPAAGAAAIDRPRARWVAAAWSELPGWRTDVAGQAWPAFLRSCDRPAQAWAAACANARRAGPGMAAADDAVRGWFEQHLQPYRVESIAGETSGLATGYFEPLVEASRGPRSGFDVPLFGPPPDLASRRPYWTRRQLESLPAAARSVRGSEIAWVRDRLDALILQIQGSGRLRIAGPGHPPQLVRVAYAANNDHPYQSVGRWLIDQGELRPGEASWPAIRTWARQNPQRLDEMLWSNPRVVFFREEPLPDPSVGPKGAQGVPLTPGRSIAVDPLSVPYGSPVWLDTTEPLSSTPLRRLVVAQDTGSAITGAVRA